MNIHALLEPIAADAPAGVDLRSLAGDLTLERIRELRSEIAPEEDLAAGQGKDADWPGIIATCDAALRTRTKDLELANALTEAWTRTQGFEGLADGIALIRELGERFWSCIHPGCEEGEIVASIRARHLSWLGSADTFLYSVRHAPLLRPDGQAPLSWAQRQEALRLEALRLTSQAAWKEAQRRPVLTLEAFDAALAAMPLEPFRDAQRAVEASRRALEQLDELCRKQFDPEAEPNLMPLRDLLDEIAEFLRERLPGEAPEPIDAEAAAAPQPQLAPAPGAAVPAPQAAIETRADALRMLGELAVFFRRTEPHSPVSYLVQRAVRWGEMPLENVLKEVVKDPAVLKHIWDTLGITPSEE